MKKLLTIMMALAFSLSFAACSSTPPASTDADQAVPQGESGTAESGGTNEVGEAPDSASTGGKLKVGATLKDLSDQFVKNIGDAMQAAADEHSDEIEFEMLDGQGDVSKQIEQVESFITKGYDVVIMVAQDAEGCGAIVDLCAEAGVPLIECNTLTTNENYTVYVGSDDVNAGKIQAEFLMDRLPENAKVAYLMGPIGQSGQIKRLEGIQQYLFDVRTDIEVLDMQTAEWKRDKAMQLAEDWLTKYGEDLDAIICQNDDMALGALAAVQAKGMEGKIIIVGVDAITDALTAVKDGYLACTVFQNSRAQSSGAIEAAIKIGNGEQVDKLVDIPFELVTSENVDNYIGAN